MSPQHLPVVFPPTATYNSTGEILCPNGGKLFNSNGKEQTSNQTSCNATAQWIGLDDLECWKCE